MTYMKTITGIIKIANAETGIYSSGILVLRSILYIINIYMDVKRKATAICLISPNDELDTNINNPYNEQSVKKVEIKNAILDSLIMIALH